MRFHRDRYLIRYRAGIAGTGGGKTFAGTDESLGWTLGNPGCVGIIFEPTYGMLKRILIRQTLEDSKYFLGRPLEANPLIREYHKTENRIEFVNGSTIWLVSLDNPEAAEGSSIDWAYVDEARLIPRFEDAWESIIRRLRGSGRGEFPIGAWITTTPTPPDPNPENVNSLYNFFENAKTKDPQSKVYRWSLPDNIYADKQYIESMMRSHTGGLAEVFIYGRFANIGVGSFGFDYTRHVIGESNCPYKQLPTDFKEVVYGVDFGWTNPSAILAVGLDGDGRAYVLDEFYQSRCDLETLIEEAAAMQTRHGEGSFICDRSEPLAIDKMRRNGLQAKPAKSKRDEGIIELGGRFTDAGDGRPRIYLHPSCVNTVSELQVYQAEKKENDHAVDALRYALETVLPMGEIEVSFMRRPR